MSACMRIEQRGMDYFLHIVHNASNSSPDAVSSSDRSENQAFIFHMHFLRVHKGRAFLSGAVYVVDIENLMDIREVRIIHDHLRHLVDWECYVYLSLKVFMFGDVRKRSDVFKIRMGEQDDAQ